MGGGLVGRVFASQSQNPEFSPQSLIKLGVVMYISILTCVPITWEMEARGHLRPHGKL